jgi:hypothetical protein
VLQRPLEPEEFFIDEVMRRLLASSLETAQLGPDGFTDIGTGPGSAEAAYIDWLTIADPQQSVVDDVARIRSHPLVPGRIPIHGFIYDVSTGRLNEVAGATAAGEAKPAWGDEPSLTEPTLLAGGQRPNNDQLNITARLDWRHSCRNARKRPAICARSQGMVAGSPVADYAGASTAGFLDLEAAWATDR